MSGPLSSLPSLSIINSGHRMGSEWKERTRPDHGWWWQAKEGPAPRRSRLIPPHVILASFAAQRAEPFGRGEECNVGERRQTETKGEGPVAARKGEDDNKRAEIDDGRLKDSSPHSSLRSSPVVHSVRLSALYGPFTRVPTLLSLHSSVRGLRRLRHEGGEWWPKRSDKGTKNRPSPRPSLLTPLVGRVPRVWLVPLAYASGTKDEPHEWVRSVSVSLRFTPSFTHPFATPRFAVSSLVAAGVDGEGEVSEERDPRERDRRSLRSSLRFITCFPSVSRS